MQIKHGVSEVLSASFKPLDKTNRKTLQTRQSHHSMPVASLTSFLEGLCSMVCRLPIIDHSWAKVPNHSCLFWYHRRFRFFLVCFYSLRTVARGGKMGKSG